MCHDLLDGVGSLMASHVDRFTLNCVKGRQNKVDHVTLRWTSDTDPNAPELLRSQQMNHRLQATVSTGAAAGPNAYVSELQIEVVDDDDDAVEGRLPEPHCALCCFAAVVHERLWFHEHDRLAA